MDLFAYYWKSNENTSSNYFTELRIFCLNEDNENVCVRIENFKSRFYLDFSDKKYLEENFSLIKNKISEVLFNKSDRNSIKIVKKRKLYGSEVDNDNNPVLYPYIQIYVTSRISALSLRKKINDLNFECSVKCHELNVSPELQFSVERKISSTGWFKIKSWDYISDPRFKISRCSHEYIVQKTDVFPSDKISAVDISVMAWDIEAQCKDIGKNPGSFAEDCVFQISCVFFKTLSKKIDKYLLTLGRCKQFADDVTVLLYETEKDLILGFSDLITKKQPNIMTGWNIFKFDITFLINRAEHNMCFSEFSSFGFIDEPGKIINLKWFSKAYLTTEIKYIDVEGILSIDLIEIVRKDYKLDSYSLNFVSNFFLQDEKDDITFKDILYAYNCFLNNSENLEEEFTKIGKYCVQDSKLVIDLFDKLQTWLALAEMSKTTSTTIMSVHLNGQQKKIFNQIYRYCYHENILVESDVYKSLPTDKYAGAYVFDPKPGLYEYVVPLDFASLYPSIIIAYNLDYTTICNDDSVSLEKTFNFEWEDHIGCEHDQLIIQKNILSELIENSKDKNQKKNLIKNRANITKKINKNILCQKRKFRFWKPEYYCKGVLPTIIQTLLDARKEVRKTMKSISDKTQLDILNQRQLSYKVSANSMYGATGVRSGALPFMPIAMCVTYIGRTSIQKAATILNDLKGTIVYGDTDSNYVFFPNITGSHEKKCEEIWNYSLKVAKIISSHFPDPMKIEFEETIYYKFMILTKKRYMYYSCKRNGEISNKIGQKGVLLARRDNCKFVKDVYEKTVGDVFSGKTKEEVYNNILESIINLLTMRIPVEKLKITKSINDYNECKISKDENNKSYMGNYIIPKFKDDINSCINQLPAQVQLEIKMVNRGFEKSEGSRIEYIVADTGFKKQCEKIENYKYFLNNKNSIKIDYLYYINRLQDPLEQIFESIFSTQNYIEENLKCFQKKTELIKEINSVFKPIEIKKGLYSIVLG